MCRMILCVSWERRCPLNTPTSTASQTASPASTCKPASSVGGGLKNWEKPKLWPRILEQSHFLQLRSFFYTQFYGLNLGIYIYFLLGHQWFYALLLMHNTLFFYLYIWSHNVRSKIPKTYFKKLFFELTKRRRKIRCYFFTVA